MVKRVNKIAKAAHIKRNTEGTSNEISFSVLDAAKNRLDGDDGNRSNPLGLVPLFTLRGKKKSVSTPSKDEGLALTQRVERSSGSSSLRAKRRGKRREERSRRAASENSASRVSTADLVAARKARRKRSKFLAIASIALAACVAMGSLGWWAYCDLSAQQQSKMGLQSAFETLQPIDSELEEIDGYMTRIDGDGAMAISLDDVEAFSRKLGTDETQVEEGLASASDAARTALEQKEGPSTAQVLEQSDAAIEARSRMFQSGKNVVDQLKITLQAKEKATSAWQQLLAGDAAAREAASLVANATEENLTASTEKSNEAVELFNASLESFLDASLLCPKVDFSNYVSYVNKRVEAQGYAVASNNALASKDTAAATEQNDLYTRADEEATALVEKLPSSPIELLSDVFEDTTESYRGEYDEAQVAARAADAFISDYLGASSK